ncbi:hypothetical protein [Novosphingobium mangrovi (ex Huang et al. 2023)]|uniref:Oligosaccharide repeat unit polymerase n=1 Tax=Novosphingobium mangrovi (ex Huang et al. 2023) TaxID=2976432 RepID=A0ABT2I1N9_9SPHN|nr:hypothetical protein [Novosphingobium mangrovi (ex Huang et al. 2023)]MCT2398710.1 hypothetical protein [Novosphingobium mangrovi (ex Huang et al. 2023)]
MNMVPIALFWTLAIWGLLSRKPVLLYLFFASMPIGAFAVIPTALTGGLTFTATPIVALLLIARTFADRSGPSAFLSLAVLPGRLMLLTLFWLVAAIATAFMPRLFEGAVMVVPIRGTVSAPAPLQPTPQNISQFTYLSIAVFSVFAFARALQPAAMRQHALNAMCLGGFVTVVTGLLDYASQFLPLAPLLEPFRTASYALLTDIEVLGAKRVVGLMPEASAYGGLCLALLSALYFYRRAMADDILRNVYTPIVLGLLTLCAWLSTSSATYVGMAVLVFVAALEWFLRITGDEHKDAIYRKGLAGEMSATVTIVIAIAVLTILQPQILDPVYSLVQRMVLEKPESSSFSERGMWRSTALAALPGTHGLGVGLGGTRSSSGIVAMFSSTGIPGGLLFYAFIVQSLSRRSPGAPGEPQLILSAFRFSFIAPFVVSLVVGDADFGGIAAFGYGLVAALAVAGRPPQRPAAIPIPRAA